MPSEYSSLIEIQVVRFWCVSLFFKLRNVGTKLKFLKKVGVKGCLENEVVTGCCDTYWGPYPLLGEFKVTFFGFYVHFQNMVLIELIGTFQK